MPRAKLLYFASLNRTSVAGLCEYSMYDVFYSTVTHFLNEHDSIGIYSVLGVYELRLARRYMEVNRIVA